MRINIKQFLNAFCQQLTVFYLKRAERSRVLMKSHDKRLAREEQCIMGEVSDNSGGRSDV